MLYERDVTIMVPEGIDLLRAAIDTLRKEKEEALKEYEDKVERIDIEIQKLALLEYQKDGLVDDC